MPPKPTVNADDILTAAISIIRESGSGSINARSIAGKLNCSTRPIFRVYENMEKLKDDVYGKALEFYYLFLNSNEADKNDILLSVGKNYILFASKEKELFKYLFLTNKMHFKSLEELVNIPDMCGPIQSTAASTGLNEKVVKDMFLKLWLFAHGIATMFATNPCALDNQEIEQLLISAFRAQLCYLKSEGAD